MVSKSPQLDEVDELLRDIFAITGQKVTLNDPIVAAALFQSRLIKRAGGDAAAMLADAVAVGVLKLEAAANENEDSRDRLIGSVTECSVQFADCAKKVAEQELATISSKFTRSVSDAVDLLRREIPRGDKARKHISKSKFWGFVVLSSLASLIIGYAVCKVLAGSSTAVTQEQLRLIYNGKLLDEAWAKLPKTSQEIIQSGTNSKNRNGIEVKADKSNQIRTKDGSGPIVHVQKDAK